MENEITRTPLIQWTLLFKGEKTAEIKYTTNKNNNVMSRYDHKIETSLEGIEHLSKEKKEEKERKMKEKNHYYNPLIL